MKPIHIVTGFFDIGRAHFDGYERDNETYFSYFRFWARIRNEMTVYCAPDTRRGWPPSAGNLASLIAPRS